MVGGGSRGVVILIWMRTQTTPRKLGRRRPFVSSNFVSLLDFFFFPRCNEEMKLLESEESSGTRGFVSSPAEVLARPNWARSEANAFRRGRYVFPESVLTEWEQQAAPPRCDDDTQWRRAKWRYTAATRPASISCHQYALTPHSLWKAEARAHLLHPSPAHPATPRVRACVRVFLLPSHNKHRTRRLIWHHQFPVIDTNVSQVNNTCLSAHSHWEAAQSAKFFFSCTARKKIFFIKKSWSAIARFVVKHALLLPFLKFLRFVSVFFVCWNE